MGCGVFPLDPMPNSKTVPYVSRRVLGLAGALTVATAMMPPLGAVTSGSEGQQPPAACRVSGHAAAAGTALPGVAITIKNGPTVKGSTSTDTDGSFGMSLTPGTYTLAADLTGFAHVEHAVTIGEVGAGCGQTVDFALALAPRNAPAPVPATASATAPAQAAPGAAAAAATPAPAGRGARNATATGANGRARGGQPTLNGFQTVEVQQSGDAAAAETPASATETEQATRALLPPGFSGGSLRRRHCDQRQRGQHRSRRVERSIRRDRAGRIRSHQSRSEHRRRQRIRRTGRRRAGFRWTGGGGFGGGRGGPGGPGGGRGPGGA